jgi:hypothetical protein
MLEWPFARAAAILALAAAAATWALALANTPLLAPGLLAAGPVAGVPLAHGLLSGRQGETAFGAGIVVLIATGGATVGPVAGGWALLLGLGAWVVIAASLLSLIARVEQFDPRVLRSFIASLTLIGVGGLAVGGLAMAFSGRLPERTIAFEAAGVIIIVGAIGMATARITAPSPGDET